MSALRVNMYALAIASACVSVYFGYKIFTDKFDDHVKFYETKNAYIAYSAIFGIACILLILYARRMGDSDKDE